MMKRTILTISMLMLFAGCSNESSTISDPGHIESDYTTGQENFTNVGSVYDRPGKKIAYDDDATTDNDIYQTVSAMLAWMQESVLNVISWTFHNRSHDNHRLRGISATMYYYGYEDEILGQSTRLDTRYQWSPFSSYVALSDKYNGTKLNQSDFRNDLLLDDEREDPMEGLCRDLGNLQDGEKVPFVATGNLYNVEEFMKHTTHCKGFEVIRDHVSELVLVGWMKNDKIWDMNFGAFGEFHESAVKATQFVINTSPVPVTIVPEAVGGEMTEVYQQYQNYHTDSPMALGLSAVYGTKSKIEHGGSVWDAVAVLYALTGGDWHGTPLFGRESNGHFTIDNDGRVKFGGSDNPLHSYLTPLPHTHQMINDIFVEIARRDVKPKNTKGE